MMTVELLRCFLVKFISFASFFSLRPPHFLVTLRCIIVSLNEFY